MATQTDVNLLTRPSALLPTKQPDAIATPIPLRVNGYGDAVIGFGPEAQAADEGTLFVVTNPTFGTAIQVNVAAENAVAPTQPTKTSILAIINGNPAGGASIRPKSFKILLKGTAPTVTASMEFLHRMQAASRGAISNNVALTPVNTNGGRSQKSGATFQFATTSCLTFGNSPDGAGLICGRSSIPTSLGIAGDQYVLKYGDDDNSGSIPGLTATRSTATARVVADAPAIVIPPGWTYTLDFFWLAQAANAFSCEFEFKYVER